jgi:hypothetical protein
LIRLVIVLLLASCAMTPTQRREESLVRDARTFNDDLRWGRYEQLGQSLSREEAKLMLARAEAAGDDLMMADYEVTAITFAVGSEAATVSVKFDWYSRRANILHSTFLEQRWEFQGGRWLMTKQRRTRGDRLLLVPEPVAPPEGPPGTPANPPPG